MLGDTDATSHTTRNSPKITNSRVQSESDRTFVLPDRDTSEVRKHIRTSRPRRFWTLVHSVRGEVKHIVSIVVDRKAVVRGEEVVERLC